MRDFNCYFWYNDKAGKLTDGTRRACYSFMNYLITYNHVQNIYIDTHDNVNIKDLELVCSLINEVTPCFVAHNSELILDYPVVKYQLLKKYKKDLLLCNFIRYTWCDIIPGTSKVFFETLHKRDDIKDPIERLTTANKEANNIIEKYNQGFNHCNYGYAGIDVKVRTLSDFLKTEFYNISSFLS